MTIARATVDLTWSGASGSPGANVWHFRWDGDLSGSAQAQTLLDGLETFYDSISDIFGPGLTAEFAGLVTGLGPDLGDTGSYTPWTVTSSGIGNWAPPSNCILVDWHTSTGGRRGRGRTFLGPLAIQVSSADGTPGAGSLTLVQDAADDLVALGADPGNGAWGVYSRADGVVRDFTSATVPDMFAVLRSRRD